ncbi:MAG: hypothetical protein KJ674_00890 [Nanoarchaeota archaeon]|nr:hypothetical protein [Nanoarchaeota archaeon]
MRWILIAILVLFFISGCSQEPTSISSTFIGGTEGISVTFKDIAPPSEFNQGEDVAVKVILKNDGEYDVVTGNANAKIYGINVADFGLSGDYKSNVGLLRGMGEFLEEGGEQEINFGNLNYNQEVTNSRDFTIRSKVCYPYQTRAEIGVCIKSSTSEEAGETICSLSGEKVIAGSVSGAPIQITSLTQETRGSNQVRFDIMIENQGGGNVYSEDVTCDELDDDMIRLNNNDKLTLEVLSPLDVLCSFRSGEDSSVGEIELDNNIEKVSCWMDVEDVYDDILKIRLKYMYTDTTSKDITIFEI